MEKNVKFSPGQVWAVFRRDDCGISILRTPGRRWARCYYEKNSSKIMAIFKVFLRGELLPGQDDFSFLT